MPAIRPRSILLGLVIVLGIATAGLAYTRWSAISCSPFAGGPCVRVLFIGNSYTFANDLPAIFRRLARSGGRNIEVSMVALPGETLEQHAASTESMSAIRDGRWQFVVIQEQSQIPADRQLREAEMYPAARTLVAAAERAGAKPVLLETWAHRDGWPERGLRYDSMQASITEGYRQLAGELGIDVAPAGEAWESLVCSDPSAASSTSIADTLWQSDGSHPTTAGSYLAACVLYAEIFDASPVGLPDTEDLAPDLAHRLEAASQVATAH